MITNCKHTFKDEYGYCPNCGQTIKVLTKKQIARKSVRPQPEYIKNSEVERIMKVAAETVEIFSELYKIEIDLHTCNREGAYHTMEHGRHQIYLGVGYMKEIMVRGFVDYRADWIFHKIGHQKGENAVKALVAHEFAHAIQVEDGQRFYGQMHNRYWEMKYNELVGLLF